MISHLLLSDLLKHLLHTYVYIISRVVDPRMEFILWDTG